MKNHVCFGLVAVAVYICGAVAQTETIPFDWLFPSSVPTEDVTMSVAFDVDIVNATGSSSSSFPGDNNEEDEPFGSLFLTSPNQAALSDLSESSDWVVTSCDATSVQPQNVFAFCSKPMGSSQCAHVMTGGAEQTIVKMPAACGKGPLARVVSLRVHADHSVLSPNQLAKKPATESLYALSFDYDFAAIPADNGPVYMRADASDIPGYWDAIVDDPISSKRSMSSKFHRRGFWSSLKSWVARITTVTTSSSKSRTFTWADSFPLFSISKSCPATASSPVAYSASLTASVSGNATFATTYGFYLQGTIVPPSVSTAYVYFNGNALAAASFTLSGTASVTYDSTQVQLVNIGFPGLSVPGIITIGPSLNLVSYITGQITLDGSITTGIQYQFPPVNFALGPGSNMQSNPVAPQVAPSNTLSRSFSADVSINANLALHIVPSVQLGINVLNGALIDAQAYVQADLFAGVALNATVGTSTAPTFCVNAFYGVTLSAGVRGKIIFWSGAAQSFTFYSNQFSIASQCFSPSKKRELLEIGMDVDVEEDPSFGIRERDLYMKEHGLVEDSRDGAALSKRFQLPGSISCPK